MNVHTPQPRVSEKVQAFLAKPHKLLIGGKWVDAVSGRQFEVEDPATGAIIAKVAEGDQQDVDLAVKAARQAFEKGPWATMLPAERQRIILRLADLIEENGEELAELESLDTGKPIANARASDIPDTVSMFRYMAGWPLRLNGETIPISEAGDWHAYTVREPVGVVGQIIPWNFPLLMASWKVAPALAAGCTIVLKPAEQTPLTALRLGELVSEAGFPDGVVNIISGFGKTAGAALSAHMDVDKIAFTGSTETGRAIVRAATGNLKRVSLELGGKSPAFVFPDADLTIAVPGIANAIFYNSGQGCTVASRVFVHEEIFEDFSRELAAFANNLKIGHGLDGATQIGPLVSKVQFDKVKGYINSGLSEGASLLTGGALEDSDGYFVAPTILTDTNRDMKVVREEIFGPVMCLQMFSGDDFDEIAKIANDTEYGLHASIWTRDLKTAHVLARKIRAGGICINAHNYGNPALPFGGFKQSGWGREMGKEVIEHYTETKSIAMKL
nr:aldehyde dehydrogenase family protein [uncultured Devosia sp.]